MRLPCYAHAPDAIEALTRDGLRLLRLGNLREAEFVLHRAAGGADHLSAGPNVPLIRARARGALAEAYRLQGRYAEAEAISPFTPTQEESHAALRNPAARRLAYA
jgi:hypothetical protein